MTRFRLRGGTVHDPANGIDGQVMDLWVQDCHLVAPPDDPTSFQDIDVSGRVVMPGGIDMHCHVVGSKVNHGRLLQPEQARRNALPSAAGTDHPWQYSGVSGSVPTLMATGYQYLGLGYTTCFDAAISPLGAKQAHLEFQQLPNVDHGWFTLVGNNHYVMDRIRHGDPAGLETFLGWLMHQTGGYAPKLANPGGVELWKQSREGNARDLDQTIDGFEITPRQILQGIARATNAIGLPHPIHIHTNNLGLPGNWSTTLETMKSLDGLRAHLAHIQFHSYGGGDEEEASLTSKVAPLADYINEHPELTVDVGQVMFGPTTSMTGDGPLGYYLHQIHGDRWYSADTELESGCGVSPIEYRNRNRIHALQWAIGLEWYLRVNNPWQIAMSTDHPNGGNFRAYPQIIRLLMDREYRAEALATVHPSVLKHSPLADMTREYSLQEIAIITRAAPARMLGLTDRGQLGVGALADICVYTPQANLETMFSLPWLVIKSGERLIEDGEIRRLGQGAAIRATPDFDRQAARHIENWFDQHYSIPLQQFAVPGTASSR